MYPAQSTFQKTRTQQGRQREPSVKLQIFRRILKTLSGGTQSRALPRHQEEMKTFHLLELGSNPQQA